MGVVIKLLVCAALSASVYLSVSRLYNRLDQFAEGAHLKR